ncbi:hypothetical protein BD309DRAFT_43549 [Dichomitus squalens]|uniref:Uncharacterized protein n=1 Tax=Dichomitus squalens TaxID=114155 RepID=A0A4Q9QDB7_9APHY|nr:hypothetical protein BD309DRAFT_43549 [Dichomitus squalens]TBU65206.1 hypothetical protein BD310DRAFT_306109 [Dichomitus squalens]
MPGSSPPPMTNRSQAAPPNRRTSLNRNDDSPYPRTARAVQPNPLQPQHPDAPHRLPFSWSSSLLTMLTVIGCFVVLCSYASSASTLFALYAAQPVYALYPTLVAAMLVGGCSALICYFPTMLAVFTFQLLFDTDIRKTHTPPPGSALAHAQAPAAREMGWSLIRDGATTIKLALLVAPVYVMAVGRVGSVAVESRALDAAAGGQLAAAIMTLKIMTVGMREIWDLVPLVIFRWHRDVRRQ